MKMRLAEDVYEAFMKEQVLKATGDRKRRLADGLGHAERLFLEQVWWPAVGHFDYLHAEYEVRDFKDGRRYVDFAYLRPPYKVCIELDGYGPHCREITRAQFADQLIRQNHLVLDQWIVFRFAYDEIKEKPRQCQQTILQLMGNWYGDFKHVECDINYKEREVLRFAAQKLGVVSPVELSKHMGVSTRVVRELLHALCKKELLVPLSGVSRIRSYGLHPRWKGWAML
ncbi:DNA-binding response regulator [Paenibacillus sp. YYML68]|uniref:DNA-binding response regulator n=1 Tax=Paenibacillus sp. YYML68 TaxID=2909250 RepID=UPI002492672A|nr:DNA-binding response regulator [Paenibacillus sp. YYML68]